MESLVDISQFLAVRSKNCNLVALKNNRYGYFNKSKIKQRRGNALARVGGFQG